MPRRTFTDGQRAAIYEARQDYRSARLFPISSSPRSGGDLVATIADETKNYWWRPLDRRAASVARRYITFGFPS